MSPRYVAAAVVAKPQAGVVCLTGDGRVTLCGLPIVAPGTNCSNFGWAQEAARRIYAPVRCAECEAQRVA